MFFIDSQFFQKIHNNDILIDYVKELENNGVITQQSLRKFLCLNKDDDDVCGEKFTLLKELKEHVHTNLF